MQVTKHLQQRKPISHKAFTTTEANVATMMAAMTPAETGAEDCIAAALGKAAGGNMFGGDVGDVEGKRVGNNESSVVGDEEGVSEVG
jgi:hypothetical protein